MGDISSNAVKRQAAICLALVKETDRSAVESRRSADQELAAFYRQHREYGARDRRFFSNAVFSWFRWRGWLKTPSDANIALAILMDASEIPSQIEHMLEDSILSQSDLKAVGALGIEDKAEYLRRLFNIPSLQIDECWNRACPSTPLGALSLSEGAGLSSPPQVNPLKTEKQSPTSEDPATLKFTHVELVPVWFPDFLFSPDKDNRQNHLIKCITSFQARPPTWLRLPLDREGNALDLLAKAGYEIEHHPLLKQAVFVKGQKKIDAAQFPEIEVQDLASQCVGLCCRPEPEEQWWDLCAGSGGKSFHLADLMKDKGLILATDIRPQILSQLAKRLKKNNYRSIKMSLWDGAGLPAVAAPCRQSHAQYCGQAQTLQTCLAPDKHFDGVLVDAPCSGSGTWSRNPDARWRIFPGQIRHYADIQITLLEIAAKKVKPGGRLVYSTCSLTTLENAGVIKTFLEQHHDFRLEPLFNPLTRAQTDGLIWIWPWEWNSNGMFIAVLRKNCISTALP